MNVAGDARSGKEAEEQSGERSVATLLTGTGPSWELHGPRVARRLRHSSSSRYVIAAAAAAGAGISSRYVIAAAIEEEINISRGVYW